MALDSDAVEAVAFDSYGTLVDVMSIEDTIGEYVDSPEPVTKLMRNRSLGYAMVGNAIEEYDSFLEMNRHALRYAVETLGLDVSEDEREEIISALETVPVFDDVHPALERLNEAGYDCYVVSNGSEDMLETMVDHGDLGDLVADTVSADEIEQFKPDAPLYRHAADRIGVEPEAICYTAAGWWDVPGAVHVGMQGVWINRQDTLWGPYETEPALTIDSMGELADELE
ncbi:haloacid dehalogenase type II [Halomicrobium salinisoli]|uniref:haloacid dehalogenase type II n=1 Tax=Halomicrobium salinisoli TaxID=2878391 RepID=UPI001CF03F0B|nr:haloacid dehalogenase type II [Halomicrobium salinisoli]